VRKKEKEGVRISSLGKSKKRWGRRKMELIFRGQEGKLGRHLLQGNFVR